MPIVCTYIARVTDDWNTKRIKYIILTLGPQDSSSLKYIVDYKNVYFEWIYVCYSGPNCIFLLFHWPIYKIYKKNVIKPNKNDYK